MKTWRRMVLTAFLALVVGAGVLAGIGRAQDAPKKPSEKAAVAAAPQEVRPAFLTPREKNATPVFLGWTWLSIAVLLYVLRLKVREADRVYLTGLYEDTKGPKEPPKL